MDFRSTAERLLCIFCTVVHFLVPTQAQEPPLRPQDREHWAYIPPRKPSIPTVKQPQWAQNPIDFFILSKLDAAGLTPSPSADRSLWLRRVYFDLIGLPPTPQELDEFNKDISSKAFEKVVDRLLNSPHYGERWAQHWLDVVRFAESNGYELDGDRPNAWRYRDYVVRSLNDNKPYDRFLTEQLAGDELAQGKDPQASADLLIATGLHRCGPVHIVSGNVDREVARQEVLTEVVQGLSSAMLGLTVNCARCHDHKFDAISQADYYRLESFFAATQFVERVVASPEEKKKYQEQKAAHDAKIKPFKTQIDAMGQKYHALAKKRKIANLPPNFRSLFEKDSKQLTADERKLYTESTALIKIEWSDVLNEMPPEDRKLRDEWRREVHALEAIAPRAPGELWSIEDSSSKEIPPTFILKRGEVSRKGDKVEPAYLRVLPAAMSVAKVNPLLTGSPQAVLATSPRLRRTDLARWLTDPQHPLTARVMVNRLWQHHFGQGLVASPNDFGVRGVPPTHPELLDWLATEFVEKGWQLKHLHRLMVLSNTYRQSSALSKQGTAQSPDPENKLLSRMNRQRLEGETIRDAILSVAGTLNPQVGGPSIKVPLEPEVYDQIFTEGERDGLWMVTPEVTQHSRRSLYLFAKRNVRLPLLEAFDQPDRLTPCADRGKSIYAPQALILMNGPFAQEQSRAAASNLLKHAPNSIDEQVRIIFRRAYSRQPDDEELTMAKQFLSSQAEMIADRLRARLPVGVPEQLPAGADVPHAVALADFCLAIMNSNEFVYVK
jgi:hypothetical protein